MILEIFWQAAQYFGVFLCLLFGYLTYKHSQTMKVAEFYRKQGVFMMPGYDNFIVGNLGGEKFYRKEVERRKRENLRPIRNAVIYGLD